MKTTNINIEKKTTEVKTLSTRASRYDIKTNDDVVKATELLKKIKEKYTELENERKTYTAPINESLKKLNAKFKILTPPLQIAMGTIKHCIEEYRIVEKEKQEKLENTLKKEGNNVELAEAPSIIESKTGALRFRKYWTFEIEDIKKVPRQYMMLNEKLIQDDIQKGTRSIKGLKIFEKEKSCIY